MLRADGLVEQDLGAVAVGEPEEVDGIRLTPVDVGNPHAVVEATRPTCRESARCSRCTSVSPTARTCRWRRRLDDGEIEARVWERGAGETASSGTSAVAVAAAFGFGRSPSASPAARSTCASRGPSVPDRAGAESLMKGLAGSGLTIAVMLLGVAGSSHASSTSCKVAVVFTNMPPEGRGRQAPQRRVGEGRVFDADAATPTRFPRDNGLLGGMLVKTTATLHDVDDACELPLRRAA